MICSDEKRSNEKKSKTLLWCGEIPDHWKLERAKWLFRKMDRPANENDDVVTCFRDGIVTLRKNRRIAGFTESLKEIGYQGIRKGDLVIHAMDAFAGAIGVSDSDGKGTPVYSVCKPNENVNAHYYAYIVREMSRSQWILALAKGIRERSTDFRYQEFANQYLPVPPIEEQNAIVKYLDYIDHKVKKYIRAKQKMIKLLNEQKQAIIHQAVTRGLDPNVRLKPSGVEWLGDIPEHWDIVPGKSCLKEKKLPNKGLIVKNVLSLSYGKIIEKPEEKLHGLVPLSFETYQIINTNDIIFRPTDMQNDHTSLRFGISRGRGIITSAYMCLGPKGPMLAEYTYQLNHFYDVLKILYSLGNGLRQNIGWEDFKYLPIVIPPIDEQNQIILYINSVSKDYEKRITIEQTKIKLMNEYLSRIISDIVTGKRFSKFSNKSELLVFDDLSDPTFIDNEESEIAIDDIEED